ncbi:MAG TPA: hypothetical protein V6D03_00475 [Candidatus Caenarcaniphilales bacterium]
MLHSPQGPPGMEPISPELYKQMVLTKVCVYSLTRLSASVFLFSALFNLLQPSLWQRWMGTVAGSGTLLATLITVDVGHSPFPATRGMLENLAPNVHSDKGAATLAAGSLPLGTGLT